MTVVLTPFARFSQVFAVHQPILQKHRISNWCQILQKITFSELFGCLLLHRAENTLV